MDSRMQTLLTLIDRFDATVDSAAASGRWSAPSPCDEWTAADVVGHVVTSQREFLAARGVDLPADAGEGASPEERWATQRDVLRTVVTDDDFVTSEYDGYFSTTTVADTLHDFYGFDLVVHRWDLARAAGVPGTEFADDELDLLEPRIDALGETLYSSGASKPALPVAEDAPRSERLLARLGRAA